ncbi:hypothetical protein JCM4914_32810 [Streptomyces platensis subsp. malvinus]
MQETWLRWQALPAAPPVDNPRGFLTTVVSRLCYDLLGSARARRERYVGPWLPAVLDPEVVWRTDGGGRVSAARRPVLGREKVARYALGLVTRGAERGPVRVALQQVNGALGLVFADTAGRQAGVFAFTVHDGRITEVDAVVNPEKLGHVDLCRALAPGQG